MAVRSVRKRLNKGGYLFALGAIVFSFVLGAVVVWKPANVAAFTNTYPDMDATDCSGTYGIYSWCKGGSPTSSRNFYYRNCTDGAAYWVKLYTGVTIPGSWADADNWNEAATSASYTVKAGTANTIEPGDIAQSDDGDFGHVGFVTEVNKDGSGNVTSIRVAELNKSGTGNYTHDNYSSKNGSGKLIRSGANDWDHFIDVNGEGSSTTASDDFVLYRLESGSGTWYAKSGASGQPTPIWGATHGSTGDVPITGDFNGDNIDDFGIYRLENGTTGTWYVKSGADGQQTAIWGATHGSPGDIPVMGDFTGDGIDDFGIYRLVGGTTGTWYVKSGANGQQTAIWGATHGSPGDIPVTGDFSGDGIADFGIYRMESGTNGTWYVKSGANGQQTAIWGSVHGSPGDVPVVGDFNNDDIDDFGIYRVTGSTGYWYFKSGNNGQQIPSAWGVTHGGWSGDIPLTGDFGA